MCQPTKTNNPASKQAPSPEDIPVDADLLEPFLHAHFNMARLYHYNIIIPNYNYFINFLLFLNNFWQISETRYG
jgi:hypothetical protein